MKKKILYMAIGVMVTLLIVCIPVYIYYHFFPPIRNIIYYTYQGVTVTRIDKPGRVYLYYGKCNEKEGTCLRPSIVIKWRDDEGLYGYLLFNENKGIEVIRGAAGTFEEQMGGNAKLIMKKDANFNVWSFIQPFSKNNPYQNLIEISEDIKYEREQNKEYNSHVQAQYIDESNIE